MVLVSVIVPVYNKQDYVEQCINSIQVQTYKNLEIIIIEDGSTDNSYNICKLISNKDNRVKIYRKKNGGHSAARNSGLSHANGQYIMFVDADDYLIRKDGIEALLRKGIKENCDIVLSDFTNQLDAKECYETKDGLSVLKWLVVNKYYHATMCSRLFKRSVIFDNKFFFKELITDDEEWTPKVLISSNRVGIVPINIYYRRVLSTSVTGIKTVENYQRKAIDRIVTTRDILIFLSEKRITNSDLITYITSIYFGAILIYSTNYKNKQVQKNILKVAEENKETINYFKYSNNTNHHIFYALTKIFGIRNTFIIIKFAFKIRKSFKI